jgi:serine/threonine-protein kinase
MICPSCRAENPDSAAVCFECRQALGAITRGSVVASRYEIEGTLGRGGMGVVYAAHDRVLDEKVALKTLRSDFGHDEGVTRRFLSEIKLARRVGHRTVCRIYEYGEDKGVRYISMEYVDGIDLRQLLRLQSPLPAEKAFDLAIQAVRGVGAVHEVGIVHRDLKATNIMVDPRGVVRLMDFGIAREESESTKGGLTGTGQILGTPEYMSPEQARGEKVDFRSDIYALGIVTYEIFTGRVPFRGATPMATLFMQVQEPPPLEGPLAAGIPRSVIPILRRALAKDPGERYASAQELLETLLAARAAELPEAPRLDSGEVTARSAAPVPPKAKRRSSGGLVAALLLLGAAAALIWRGDTLSILLPMGARMPPTPAVPRRAPASPPATIVPPPVPQDLGPPVTSPSAEWIEPLTLSPPPSTATAPIATPITTVDAPLTPPPAAGAKRGVLRLTVVPFAELTLDDADAGTVVSSRIPLGEGTHVLVLVHPDFEPLRRTVDIVDGETLDVRVDLPEEAVRKK